MTTEEAFERQLAGLRPKLHRFCSRMTGSAIDGEDVVQAALVKAVSAMSGGVRIENLEAWLYRVAHNASLDFLRARARSQMVELTDDIHATLGDVSQPDVTSVSFRIFLGLPVLQRCAVVLKDVLGHTIEEIAEIAECSGPAAKSALQRGRVRLPVRADEERESLVAYVSFFRAGDFDALRQMLADEVRLNLVNRLQLTGRARVDPYFTRNAEATHWGYACGAIDGRAAMLVYDDANPSDRPAHFVVLTMEARKIRKIQDFLFAPYVMEGTDWFAWNDLIWSAPPPSKWGSGCTDRQNVYVGSSYAVRSFSRFHRVRPYGRYGIHEHAGGC